MLGLVLHPCCLLRNCCRCSTNASSSTLHPKTYLAQLSLLTDNVTHLALPLEACGALNTLINQALHNVSCVHVNGAQRDELFAVKLAEVAIDELNETRQLVDLQQETNRASEYNDSAYGWQAR
jgi:hypothetical protein